MTMQTSDYVEYKNKQFMLIDIELGTKLYKEDNNEKSNFIINSSSWRGYEAEYKIDKNKKIAVKRKLGQYNELNYTGKIIIMYSNKKWINSDFIESILIDGEEAYELEFKEGELINENNLDVAISEYQNNTSEKYDKTIVVNILQKYLTGKYDMSKSYKWR